MILFAPLRSTRETATDFLNFSLTELAAFENEYILDYNNNNNSMQGAVPEWTFETDQFRINEALNQ
jgi:hypothetical protein